MGMMKFTSIYPVVARRVRAEDQLERNESDEVSPSK